MKEKYESWALADLREIAKTRGIKGTSAMRKAELVDAMLVEDSKSLTQEKSEPEIKNEKEEKIKVDSSKEDTKIISREQEERNSAGPKGLSELDSGLNAKGIIEIMPDGYGFIRCENFMPGDNDVYVAPSQIRRFNLKTGDIVEGNTRVKTQTEKFSALLFVKKVNGMSPEIAMRSPNF